MAYIILKGTQFSIPISSIFNTVKTAFSRTVKVNLESSHIYNHKDVDQYDWNKLYGFKAEYFNPRFNTVMIGWRWNIEKNCFQLIPYFHSGGATPIYNESKVVDMKIGDNVDTNIMIQGNTANVTIYNHTTKQSSVDTMTFTKTYSKFYKIFPWFGGTKNCPSTMKFNLDL